MHPGRPPGGRHLLEHPGALRDERLDPGGERLVGIDPAHQRPLDLPVPPDRLDQQRLPVGELLPHGAQRDAGPGGDPGNGRAQVAFGVQGAHRVEDRPARPVRAGRSAVRGLDVSGLIHVEVGCAQASTQASAGQAAARRAFDVHQVILR